MLAISPNSNEIHIYGGCNTSNWTKMHSLTEHDLLVSGIDWSPVHNKIVSCSHDRNAFVWTFNEADNKWNPALVILRIERAALNVRWSLDGVRFAVASGAKCVPVCTYEGANDWWVSKMVKKKFRSTVLCVEFHPQNGQLLATGSTDFKCRIFSTFSSDVDASPNAGPFESPVEFGEAYCELSALGWITALAWTPSGQTLCFAAHDSSVHFATFSSSAPGNVASHQVLRYRDLPLTSITCLSETALVGGGHDFNPLVFSNTGNEWAFFDALEKKKVTAAAASSDSGGFAASRALFQNKTTRGQESATESDTLWTTHEAVITNIAAVNGSTVSTTGMDGRVVMWNLPQLEIAMSALGL